MDRTYSVEIVLEDNQLNEKSFIGGKPYLPHNEELPVCKLCNSQLTFFFQITFPQQHKWSGLSLSMFACTNCYDENNLIPEMLSGNLKGAVIPEGFLKDFQRNFRVIVFNSNEGYLRHEYEEKIKFKSIQYTENTSPDAIKFKLGGGPDWLLDDESPSLYEGNKMLFLFQIPEEYNFERLPTARGQIKFSYFNNTLIESDKHVSVKLSTPSTTNLAMRS